MKRRGKVVLLTFACLLSLVFGLGWGSTATPLPDLVRGLFQDGQDQAARAARDILVRFRLPRVVQAFLCGGLLAVAGAALQAVLRNPLAEPFVLGVSSGSALGLVLGGLLGLGASFWARSGFAFVIGMAAVGAVLLGAWRARSGLDATTVVLAGVIVNAFASSALMVLQSLLGPLAFKNSVSLLMGRFTVLGWQELGMVALTALVPFTWLLSRAPEHDILSLGPEQARSLGIRPLSLLVLTVVAASVLTAVTVALCGVIGFVGLVAPHAVRRLGIYRQRALLPVSFVAGGCFLTIADALARVLVPHSGLPVGVVTALLGSPFFLLILWRSRGTHAAH